MHWKPTDSFWVAAGLTETYILSIWWEKFCSASHSSWKMMGSGWSIKVKLKSKIINQPLNWLTDAFTSFLATRIVLFLYISGAYYPLSVSSHVAVVLLVNCQHFPGKPSGGLPANTCCAGSMNFCHSLTSEWFWVTDRRKGEQTFMELFSRLLTADGWHSVSTQPLPLF